MRDANRDILVGKFSKWILALNDAGQCGMQRIWSPLSDDTNSTVPPDLQTRIASSIQKDADQSISQAHHPKEGSSAPAMSTVWILIKILHEYYTSQSARREPVVCEVSCITKMCGLIGKFQILTHWKRQELAASCRDLLSALKGLDGREDVSGVLLRRI